MNEFENKLKSLGVLKAKGTAGDGTILYTDLVAETAFYDMSRQSRSLSAMTGANLKLFAEDMDTIIRDMHPAVKELIVRKALAVVDAMRLANTETKSGYGGSVGSGSSLYFTVSWAYDFYDPDIVGGTRRSWTRVVTAVSTAGTPTPLITGTVVTVGTAVDLEMAEEESMLFLGMTEKKGVPHLATAMQVVYNSDTYNYWNMPFDMLEVNEQDIVLWELPQHIIVPPEQKIQLNVRYDKTGVSDMTPVVIRFRRASDMRSL